MENGHNDRKACPICLKKDMRMSKDRHRVRCANKTCTVYDTWIQLNKFNEGVLDDFIKFWETYPRKESKKDAVGAWVKLSPDKDLFSIILSSVIAHKFESVQWKSKQYIPYPGSFIRGRMWDNEIVKEEQPKVAPQFNQLQGGYQPKTTVKSTPKSKELVKEIILLGKIHMSSIGTEKERIKRLIKEKQKEIDMELKKL